MTPEAAKAALAAQAALTSVNLAQKVWNQAWSEFTALLGADKASAPEAIELARQKAVAGYEAFLDRSVEFNKKSRAFMEASRS